MNKLSRPLSGILAAVLLVAQAPVFAEMPEEAYEDAVNALEAAHIIDGYGAGNPRLSEYVNRAEALKITVLSRDTLGSEFTRTSSSMPPIPLFPDVDQKAWYAPYVEIGFKHGLVKGYPDGRLWPQGGVKVVEAVAMLARAYGETGSVPFRTSEDLPNKEGEWYTDAVSTILSRDGVMPESRLTAASYMTRGELFDMVYRMRIASGQTNIVGVVQPVITVSGSSTAQQVYVPSERYASAKSFAISIPDLNILDLAVFHPEDATTQKGVLAPLKSGVGHLFGYPGEGGKVMIYGHSSSYPWELSQYTKIFRGINKVAIGQKIYVTYKDKLFVYEVTEKRTVAAKDKAAFEPDDNGEELILYTCWPPDSITHRFLVMAKPVDVVELK